MVLLSYSLSHLWKFVLSALAIQFVVRRIWNYRRVRKLTGDTPVDLCLFAPFSIFSLLLPRMGHFWNPSMAYTWVYRHSCVILYCTNIAAYHQILTVTSDWGKGEDLMLDLLGKNIVCTEGEEWKRHRRILSPAFNNTQYHAVWQTATNVYRDIVREEFSVTNADGLVEVSDMGSITRKLALFIIIICGFGIPMQWSTETRTEDGKLTLTTIFREVSANVPLRAFLPKILFNLPVAKWRLVDEAYKQFEALMRAEMSRRETEMNELIAVNGDISDSIRDVFGRLVNAKITEGKLSISYEDVIGNCFIIMFAGHETTATALCAAVALLGLYPEAQEEVYQELKSVLGDREPTYDDFDSLKMIEACVLEAIRIFPPAWVAVRQAERDTVVSLPQHDNPEIVHNVPVKKGTCIYFDVIGTGYDEEYYPSPSDFIPSRWRHSQDDFHGFLMGPRTCLGRKFATVETVAFLSNLLLDYRIKPNLQPGESTQAWRRRCLEPTVAITLKFSNVPILLERRKS